MSQFDISFLWFKIGLALEKLGKIDEAITSLRNGVAAAEPLAVTSTDARILENYLFLTLKLLELDDDAADRVIKFVGTLRRFDNENRLPPQFEHLLPVADSLIAKYQKQ